MKTKIAILLTLFVLTIQTQADNPPEQFKKLTDLKSQREALKLKSDFVFRVVEGETNCVGDGWYYFSGKIIQILDDGILVDGLYSPNVLGKLPDKIILDMQLETKVFFVADFHPPNAVDGDLLDGLDDCTAKIDGTFTYTSIAGARSTVTKLEHGIPCSPSQEAIEKVRQERDQALASQIDVIEKEIADAAAIENQKQEQIRLAKEQVKKAANEKALKYNQEQAEKGDPTGLLRMAERYRDGDGVEKDLAKAKEYFNKAIAAGSPDAAEELGKLNQSDVK